MSGVTKNVTTGRFFEAGSMFNHEALLEKKPIADNLVAETDVNVLRYDS